MSTNFHTALQLATRLLAFAGMGVQVGLFSLKQVFTMLVNSIRWSESVAMAMEAKGFSRNAPRSYYTIPHLHWYDFLCSAVSIVAIILGILFLKV